MKTTVNSFITRFGSYIIIAHTAYQPCCHNSAFQNYKDTVILKRSSCRYRNALECNDMVQL